MAIQWGAWENHIRVGIEVTWSAVNNGSGSATATVEYYTGVDNWDWNDDQTINFSGAIGGSQGFHNGQGPNTTVKRATKTYTYNYGGSEYGSSPGNRTFTVSLSGAYNGATPSKSVTSAIPARPYGQPADPSNCSVTRISDSTQSVQWSNNATAGAPYTYICIERSANGSGFAEIAVISGGATSFNDATVGNSKYQYRVRAFLGGIGYSPGYSTSGVIFTSPNAAGATIRTTTGSDEDVDWTNAADIYAEYETEVWRSVNGTYSLLATKAAGVVTHLDVAPGASNKLKYKVRHKTTTGVQGVIYGAFGDESTETPGVTFPPLAPTTLSPSGGATVDPTLIQTFTWVHNHGGDSAAQSAFKVRHRLFGSATWTEITVVQVASSWQMAANTYTQSDLTVEWQVATKGADPSYSAWSDSATFITSITPISPDPVYVPLEIDLVTGRRVANSKSHEIRDYMMRAQSRVAGGGTLKFDPSTSKIWWTDRFLTIPFGNSETLFHGGHHDITMPFMWTVTNKVLTSNLATLTVSTNNFQVRPGETIRVIGVDATFNGDYVVRSVTKNTVTYDKTAANVASTAASGTVGPIIHGHGGSATRAVPDLTPDDGKIYLQGFNALYYEMPFGWGGGTTPRKNGVVRVLNKQLTSNVATLTVEAPHYYVVGDRINVVDVDATFNGYDHSVTDVTVNTITYAKTASNVASQAATGLVKSEGKDTFHGNWHIVGYDGDFTIPSNWLLVAVANGDIGIIEWCNGVKDSGWRAPTLVNGWTNYGGAWDPAGYRLLNGIVYLKGLIKPGSLSGTIFTLPVNFRPGFSKHTPVLTDNSGTSRLNMDAAGVVSVNSMVATPAWASLDNISFPVEG